MILKVSEPVSALGLGAASEGVLGLCEVSSGISSSVYREGKPLLTARITALPLFPVTQACALGA